jgi:hypothetical protein
MHLNYSVQFKVMIRLKCIVQMWHYNCLECLDPNMIYNVSAFWFDYDRF